MSLHDALAIAGAGLSAQRTRMETVTSNLVNARTTRTPEGGPFRKLSPIFVAQPIDTPFGDQMLSALRSVRVERVVENSGPPRLVKEPGHPDANAEGWVAYPDIEPVHEMTDLLSAVRSYEASVTAMRSVRDMMHATVEILR